MIDDEGPGELRRSRPFPQDPFLVRAKDESGNGSAGRASSKARFINIEHRCGTSAVRQLIRPEFENGGCPAGVLNPVIDGVANGALLVPEVRLHDRCQAAELSPDHLPASRRRAGRLAGKISNAGQDACDHLMVFSQLPHGVPKIGPDPQQLSEQAGVLTMVMCRQCRAEGQTVRYQPPRPAPSQDLPAGRAVAAEQLHAPERADGSMPPRGRPLERPPKRDPFRSRASMPGAVRHQHATRHTSNQARGPGSQTSSPPSPPPIDVAYRSSACKRVGGHRQPAQITRICTTSVLAGIDTASTHIGGYRPQAVTSCDNRALRGSGASWRRIAEYLRPVLRLYGPGSGTQIDHIWAGAAGLGAP